MVTPNGRAITIPFGPVCGPRVAPQFFVTADLGVLPAGVYDVTVTYTGSDTPFAQAKLVVQDADPAFVVAPNVYSGAGDVTISSYKILSCDLSSPCPLPVIRFDNVAATNARFTGQNTITVTPPPHAVGVVDVTMEQAGGTSVSHAAFEYYTPSPTPDPAFFERVLFPVASSGPGAFGAQWQTELALYNGNPFPFTVMGGAAGPQANESVILYLSSEPAGESGFVLRQSMRNANFSLRVRDLSRDATDFGTAIPVVRESGFYDRPFSIVNVPADPRYRVALRLYAYDGTPRLELRIVSMQNPPKELADSFVTVEPFFGSLHAFAYIGDLLKEFPQLAGNGPLRIEVSGANPETTAWAFVSVTNNDTQHVTVISPQ